jgi:2-methylcitrate dehydratase PrpD
VLHPYISAILRVRAAHGLTTADVAHIDCPVAAFIVPIVCEPLGEKLAPASDSHGRISLQYSIAEAFVRGALGRHAYSDASLRDPEILGLARRVRYHVDPAFPGPGRFKGTATVTLTGGRVLTEVEDYNRGSAENPMTDAELRAKFDENAGALSPAARERVADAISRLDSLPDARALTDLVALAGH